VVVLLLLAAIQAEATTGFYLVAPPAGPAGAAGGAAVNLSAPLSSWERRGGDSGQFPAGGSISPIRSH
jgi:hypothetical protein